MNVINRFLSAALIMSFLASGVLAQDEADIWKLSASVIGEGTDNRDSTVEKESNFDLFLRVRLDLNMDWDVDMLDIYYAPAYRYRSDPSYLQNDTELQHDLGIIGRRDLGNVDLRLNESFNYTDDPSVQQSGSTLRRDSSYAMNNFMAGVRVLMTEVSDVDLSVRNMIKRYDDEARALESDEDSTGAELSMWRRMEATLAGYIMAGMDVFDYDHTAGDRGFDDVYAGIGLEKSFSRDLKGGVRAGYKSISYNDSTIEDDSSPFIQGTLVTEMTAVSRVTGAIGYTLRDADVYPFSSQEATSFSVQWDWDTTPLLGIGVYVLYAIGNYDAATVPESIDATTAVVDGDERTFVMQGQVNYKINEMTSVMLSQRFEDVDADITGATSFSRNATRLGLSRQF